MGKMKQKQCAWEGCEVQWDAKGERGCGNKKWCDKHRPLVLKRSRAKYYQNNKQAFSMRQKKYNEENREQYLKQQQEYRDRNRERINEKARKYYHAHKKERMKKYSLSKEYITARNLRYYRKNRDEILRKRRERWKLRERYHKSKGLNKG